MTRYQYQFDCSFPYPRPVGNVRKGKGDGQRRSKAETSLEHVPSAYTRNRKSKSSDENLTPVPRPPGRRKRDSANNARYHECIVRNV